MKLGFDEVVLMCPLIGFDAVVVNSSSKELISFKGKVIDESKNMLQIESEGIVKKIPKKGNIFQICEGAKCTKVYGSEILYRPEEKAKNAKI